MDLKAHLKVLLSNCNPLAVSRRNKMRKSLTNSTPSFLCPNCIGGILFHDLGLQFRSPTVNTMMTQTDFVKFACRLDHYLSLEPEFFKKPGYDCPCARLDDITVHFTHYVSAEEAVQKWNERKQRIDRDNLFLFAMERDGLTREDILQLGQVPCRGLVVFTANDYPDIPYALQIPRYSAGGEVGNVLEKSWLDESRLYEHFFDFTRWFNEADGNSFFAEAYRRQNL